MLESEILLTMAEVAAAFAGFTALASVFSGRRTRDHPRVSKLLLRVMIEAALVVVFFALLPLILLGSPLEPATSWRVAAGGCMAAWLAAIGLFLRDSRRFQRNLLSSTTRWYSLAVASSLVHGNAIFLLVALGVMDSWAGSAYSLGLLLLLLNSALSFARFFFGAYDSIAE